MSANAQLLGLYPPESCNQKLTEWQQLNVKPPLLERVSDEKIAELGEHATKGGITPFDIFNQYETEDQMNDVNGAGCPKYQALRSAVRNSTEYLSFKNAMMIELNKTISDLTGISLQSYEETLELCRFLENAWYDGFTSFNTFSYEEGSAL